MLRAKNATEEKAVVCSAPCSSLLLPVARGNKPSKRLIGKLHCIHLKTKTGLMKEAERNPSRFKTLEPSWKKQTAKPSLRIKEMSTGSQQKV